MTFDKNTNIDKFPDLNKCTIAIIGLGYVGLPLAIEFAKKKKSYISSKTLDRKVIGFDINQERLEELKRGVDKTNEITNKELSKIKFHVLTSEIKSLSKAEYALLFKFRILAPAQSAITTCLINLLYFRVNLSICI